MGASNETRIRFSAKQSFAFRLLEYSPDVTEILYGGAAGGGKTWFGCNWQIYRRINYPGTRGAIGRDELKKLRRTTLKTFFDCWTTFWADSTHAVTIRYNEQAGSIQFSNGSEIVLLDLHQYPSDPDFTSLGSLEITDAFVDEATEVTEKSVQILTSRIRYRLDLLPVREPKILLAGNPAHNWVKFRFIKDRDGNPVELPPHRAFVPALLTDNPDPEFQRIYGKTLSQLGHYDRQRLLEGDWDAVARDGGEAFYTFDPDLHTGHVPFLPYVPVVHLSFDQNVVPYMTLLAAQCVYDDAGALEIRIFREYCYRHPRNSTKAVCEGFLLEYGDLVNEVFYYGDASGNKRDTRAAVSDYDIAAATLRAKVSGRSNRVQRSNPEIRKRVLFLCGIFENRVPGVRLVIDKSCGNLINDLLYIKQDANGGKVKERATENGVSFEKYGHCFRGETMVTCIDGQKRIDRVAVGDLVLTRKGWRPVERVFHNGKKEVHEFSINGRLVSCTKDHLFYTENQGFKPVSDLQIGDEICIFDHKTGQICKEKLSSLEGTGLRATPNQSKGRHGFIFPAGLPLTASALKCAFINTFGRLISGRYQPGTTYTTKTATHSTTTFPTLSACAVLNTYPNTQSMSGASTGTPNWFRSTRKQGQPLLNGIKAKRAESGTQSTQRHLFSAKQKPILAKTAGWIFRQTLSFTRTFVQRSATPPTTSEFTEQTKGITFALLARLAAWLSKKANGLRLCAVQESAQATIEEVYDLRVQGEHEYFANEVLVHNCSDALEYFVTKACESQFRAFERILQ